MKALITILLILTCSYANATSLHKKLNNFLDSNSSNITKPTAYKSQAAGYYSLGGMVNRNAIKQNRLVNLQLPKYSAGCGGIDMFHGGFSFIDHKEMIQMLQNIASNAKGYAFQLALEAVSPQVAKKMAWLQEMANKINSMNINSCEVAATAVGSIFSKFDTASESACSTSKNANGNSKDFAKARHDCRKNRDGATLDDDPLKITNTNLAYKALTKAGLGSTEKEKKLEGLILSREILMSLSGTIVITDQGSGKDTAPNIKYYPSKIMDEEFLHNLFYGGGKIKYHTCDEKEKCLNVSEDGATEEISEEASFKRTIQNRIEKILSNMRAGSELSPEDEKMITGITSFPLIKLLKVMSQYQGGDSIFELETYSDPIAAEILDDYLIKLIKQIDVASYHLISSQEEIKMFREGIGKVRQELHRREDKRKSKIRSVHELYGVISRTESNIANALGGIVGATTGMITGS